MLEWEQIGEPLMTSSYNELKKDRKDARIDIRLDSKLKDRIERAAALRNVDVSSFILNQVVPAADEEIAANDRLVLSNRDRDLFLKLVANPPEPSEKLVQTAKRFKKKYYR